MQWRSRCTAAHGFKITEGWLGLKRSLRSAAPSTRRAASRWQASLAALLLLLLCHSPARATDQIDVNVSPGSFSGAGFGELTPGPHDLSVIAHLSSGTPYFASAFDQTGTTVWSYSMTSTTVTYTIFGSTPEEKTEDRMGWIDLTGSDMMFQTYRIVVANALFPCAPCQLDPITMMYGPECDFTAFCDTTKEGETGLTAGASATVSVTVHHGESGSLTITGGTSDLAVKNPDGSPFTSAPITGTGTTAIPVLLEAGSNFTGNVTLTCHFLGDTATLDTQDILLVKAKAIDITLAGSSTVILGTDLTIDYTVPSGITLTDVAIEIRNNVGGTLVYRAAGLPKTVGSHSVTWSKAKWNQVPHSGAYANPKNGTYKVRVIGIDGANQTPSNELSVTTRLVIKFDVQDKAPTGSSPSRVAGLDDLLGTSMAPALKIVLKKGTVETVFDGTTGGLAVTTGANNNPLLLFEKHIELDAAGLNQLPSGAYQVIIRDFRDDVGNFNTSVSFNIDLE